MRQNSQNIVQMWIVRVRARIAVPSLRRYHVAMNLGFPEMIFIFFLALIIFGPKKLPEIGRQIGKALNEFKRASNEFKAQIESEISQLDLETDRKTENERRVLPPAESPTGTVAALAVGAEVPSFSSPEPTAEHFAEPVPELSPMVKAPDA
jgi:TatA/E family protein of Tat protein translocase